MSERIRIADLPSRGAGDVRPLWFLTWEALDRGASLALPEGESLVGSSARSDLRLAAPGVAPAHFRIRRDGEQVYIRPLGRARIRIDGASVRAVTPIQPGQRVRFGEASAYVERVDAEDQRAAVSIPAAAVQPAKEELRPADPLGWQLGRLTGALEEAAAHAETAIQRLAAVLVELTGIAGAAIYAGPSDGAGEWALVAEARASGAPETLAPGAFGCLEHRAVTQGGELLLVTRSGDHDHGQSREALCRHVLALAGLVRACRSTNHRKRAAEAVQHVDPWQELAGESVRKYLASCSSMCRYCDTVLVLGETGAGKELVARGLHTLWQRKGAFVGINCAAVPADLLDAELFGIESGTATGVTGRRGRIEQAAGGTLFLDEVADLPIPLQTKLLRVLQEREYYSVGGSTLRRADVHIVAATNRAVADLRGGHMRADLYFRLSQATVSLPPLRDRLDDLPALCAAFLGQLEQRFGRGIPGLSVSALAALRAHSWPGNIRELHNVLRGMYASAQPGRVIGGSQAPAEIRAQGSAAANRRLAARVDDLERSAIAAELERSGSVPAAARALGLSEGYLYRKLKKLRLPLPER